MKLKTTADGLKAVKINPHSEYVYFHDEDPEEMVNIDWESFEANNPPLDLTKQMPGNTVFEGVEVWQKFYHKGMWYTENKDNYKCFKDFETIHFNYDTRRAYEPIK